MSRFHPVLAIACLLPVRYTDSKWTVGHPAADTSLTTLTSRHRYYTHP